MVKKVPKEKKSQNYEQRRQELADFLRVRRERLKPLPGQFRSLSRRRTPGLRREEVADLSGVGTTWYTWLEQGRDIQPSSDVLERIGKALELDPFEMKHLFSLANKIAPRIQEDTLEEVPDSLKRFLDASISIPAIIVGERLDPLHWNQLFVKSLFDPSHLETEKRNLLAYLFINEGTRKLYLNWEMVAKRIIGEFRADIGDKVETPWVQDLINRLKKNSPDFERLWKAHDVIRRDWFRFGINHPTLGKIEFERTTIQSIEAPKFKMILFTPLNSTNQLQSTQSSPST